MSKSPLMRLMYALRDVRARPLFAQLDAHCRGRVLDVGGWDFFLTARERGLAFDTWVTLEPDAARSLDIDDPRFSMVIGDGCAMTFDDASFDTVLCVQVLEHVFEPFAMLSEVVRVLKPSGHAVVMAPWTANLHLAPHHYQNFTRYWFKEACGRLPVEIVSYESLGGYWSSVASRHFLYPLQLARVEGMHVPEEPRSLLHGLLAPVGVATAAIGFASAMALSVADLKEEPNNHLLVLRKD